MIDKETAVKNFGRNLRNIRLLNGMSQKELADKLNTSRANIGSYEEHRAFPPPHIVLEISNLAKLDINTLLSSEIYPKKNNA